MAASAGRETEVCRRCGAAIPATPGYTVWCDACGWNIDPRVLPPRKSALDAAIDRIAERRGRLIHERVMREKRRKPGPSAAKAVLYLFAALINLLNLGFSGLFVFIGVSVFIRNLPYVADALFLLAFMLGLAFLVRPRFPRLAIARAPRADFPGMYGLADKVAAALGSPPVDLSFQDGFNAFYRKSPFRRSVVGIGVPLFAALAADERVAVMSHEIAHGVNGDSTRSFIVQTAFLILRRWCDSLDAGRREGKPPARAIAFIRGVLLWIPSRIALLVRAAMRLLAFPEQQRAEYYADSLGAAVSGTAPAVRVLGKLFLAVDYEHLAETAGRGGRTVDRFLYRAERMPERERERLRRLAETAQAGIDSSHPPVAFRIGLLETEPREPGLILGREETALIDAEVERLKAALR